MEDPLDDYVPPLDNRPPPDDPMLEALENSIAKPEPFYGFGLGPDDRLMDHTGRLLESLEAHIEGRLPVPPPAAAPPPVAPLEAPAAPPTPPAIRAQEPSPGPPGAPAAPLGAPHGPMPGIPRRGGRSLRPRPPGRARGHFGRRALGMFCPEIHEVVTPATCDSCEKYRHWPEATDEEPRVCWHTWQLLQQATDPEAAPDSDPEAE